MNTMIMEKIQLFGSQLINLEKVDRPFSLKVTRNSFR